MCKRAFCWKSAARRRKASCTRNRFAPPISNPIFANSASLCTSRIRHNSSRTAGSPICPGRTRGPIARVREPEVIDRLRGRGAVWSGALPLIRFNFKDCLHDVFIRRGYQMAAVSGNLWFRRVLIDMCASLPPGPSNPDRDRRKARSSRATLEAAYQRKVATGWLYLAEMTSDNILRAIYERIALHHVQCADAEEAGVGARVTPSEAFPPA